MLSIFLYLWYLTKCLRSEWTFFETFSHIVHFCGFEEAPWAYLVWSLRYLFCENVLPHTVHGKRRPSWRCAWSFMCRISTSRVLRVASQIVQRNRLPSSWSMWSFMCSSRLPRVLKVEPHKSHVKRDEASTNQILPELIKVLHEKHFLSYI